MNHVHCYLCGRFVGPDGFVDIYFDMSTGCCEEGYSQCARCMAKKQVSAEVLS